MTARSSAFIGFYGYPSQSTAYIRSYLDGYLSGSLLKDGGSPTMTAWSSAHSYPSESTAYIGPTLTATLGKSPKRWRLAHNNSSKLNPWLPERVNNLYRVLP